MNYCIVAFAIVVIVSTIQWFIDGRKHFHGPQLDLDAMRKGRVVGMAADEGTINGAMNKNYYTDEGLGEPVRDEMTHHG